METRSRGHKLEEEVRGEGWRGDEIWEGRGVKFGREGFSCEGGGWSDTIWEAKLPELYLFSTFQLQAPIFMVNLKPLSETVVALSM